MSSLSVELAEFIGMMIGDGNLYIRPEWGHHRIDLSFDSRTDLKYVELRVIPLIRKLWGILSPNIYFQPDANNVKCRFYSKYAAYQLRRLGLPPNRKKEITIPPLFRSMELIPHCLRGIFDTDGSIFKKYSCYAQIGIKSHSKTLQKDLIELIRKLGFHPSLNRSSGYVFIHRQEEVIRFFSLVGSSNPKHILKFKYWLSHKEVPSTWSLINEIQKFEGPLPYTFDAIDQLKT